MARCRYTQSQSVHHSCHHHRPLALMALIYSCWILPECPLTAHALVSMNYYQANLMIPNGLGKSLMPVEAVALAIRTDTGSVQRVLVDSRKLKPYLHGSSGAPRSSDPDSTTRFYPETPLSASCSPFPPPTEQLLGLANRKRTLAVGSSGACAYARGLAKPGLPHRSRQPEVMVRYRLAAVTVPGMFRSSRPAWTSLSYPSRRQQQPHSGSDAVRAAYRGGVR